MVGMRVRRPSREPVEGVVGNLTGVLLVMLMVVVSVSTGYALGSVALGVPGVAVRG